MSRVADRLVLRAEEERDHPAVDKLTDAAFTSLPAGVSGHGQRAPTIERRLLAGLRADGDIATELTFVGEVDGEVVGHVACSWGTLAGRRAVALGPISVRPDLQRQGIGAALVTAVVVTAEEAGEPVIVLLGDPEYYGFFGWVAAATLGIESPEPEWGAAFQARPLRSWSPELAGAFRYAPAFERLDS